MPRVYDQLADSTYNLRPYGLELFLITSTLEVLDLVGLDAESPSIKKTLFSLDLTEKGNGPTRTRTEETSSKKGVYVGGGVSQSSKFVYQKTVTRLPPTSTSCRCSTKTTGRICLGYMRYL